MTIFREKRTEGVFRHSFGGVCYNTYKVCSADFMLSYSRQMTGITEAAIDAGFYSSAHFADVNRRVFGISIRSISKDLQYIKVK